MAPEAVAAALPYVNWMVLVAVAVGSFAIIALIHERTDATRGYIAFSAFIAGLIGLLALASDSALPAPSGLTIHAASANVDTARYISLAAFSALAIFYAVFLRFRRAHLIAAVLALAGGSFALLFAAIGWAPNPVDAVPLGVQLFMLSAVSGGALAALTLGHWYLVTPKLSTTPLVLETRLLLAAAILQTLLFVTWTTLGGGVDQAAFAALTGSSAPLVWMRLIVTLIFPLILIYMALRTAQTRSMESATGLLYINLAAVAAGTIGAAALYVTGGLLV
jgi:hypothetical protein